MDNFCLSGWWNEQAIMDILTRRTDVMECRSKLQLNRNVLIILNG